MRDVVIGAGGPRSRVVRAAAELLREGGSAAVTTRAVAARAGLQPPAIYRLFGDKEGLLEAVAEHVMAEQVAEKAAVAEAALQSGADPLEDLRAAWHEQVRFGTRNPALFHLLSDPGRVRDSAAAAAGRAVLEARVARLAQAGRLRLPERRAVDLIQSAGLGAIQTLLTTPEPDREADLAEELLSAVLDRVLVDRAPVGGDAVREGAIALRAVAPRLDALTEPERLLLAEWLERLLRR